MTENFKNDSEKNGGILQLINNSSEIVGGTVAGFAAGLLTEDPALATVFGAGGKALEIGFRMIGNEISERMIGPREEIRIGAAISFAIKGIRERLENGESLREDGFFDKNHTRRSDCDEVLENVVLKAQREPEEKKIPYISSIYENTAFEAEISANLSHKIIKSAEQLTYQQLCILSMVGRREDDEDILRNFQPNSQLEHPLELSTLLHDCFELVTNGYIQGGLTLTASGRLPQYEALNPNSMLLGNIGIAIFDLMSLQEILDDDIVPIAELLGWEKSTSSESGEGTWDPKV